ncbi:hypothetical protein KCU81_g749, partial [Aureobasidium melanogenum]
MPPPSRAHITAAGAQQTRQNRNARARHSLDNTGFSIDSSELPSGLIVDYSIDDVVRPGNIAELRRAQQTDHLDDEDEDDGDVDIDPEEVDPGKNDSLLSKSSLTYISGLSTRVTLGVCLIHWLGCRKIWRIDTYSYTPSFSKRDVEGA